MVVPICNISYNLLANSKYEFRLICPPLIFYTANEATTKKKLILANYLLQICFGTLGTAFISVLSLAIQNLSLTLQQFQRS